MIPVNKDNSDNVLAFLSSLHAGIKKDGKVSISSLLLKHKLPQHTPQVLKDGGIVASNGQRGPGARWEWKTTIIPNSEMAVELIRKINNYKHPQPAKELPPKVVKTPPVTQNYAPALPTIKPEILCETSAIDLLKNLGYKIMKPTFVEV